MPVTGSCTPGCGRCCEILAIPHPEDVPVLQFDSTLLTARLVNEPAAFLGFLEARGVQVLPTNYLVQNAGRFRRGKYRETPVLYIEQTCPHLTSEKRCDLYGTPERPQACNEWPTMMDDLSSVQDVCTFQIEENNNGESK